MSERERVPHELPQNPEYLTKNVRVRVLRPFMLGSKPTTIGAVVRMMEADARDAISLGRAERVED